MRHKMPFGANYSPSRTLFRLWAPRAVQVQLRRFSTGSDEEEGARLLGEAFMENAGDGSFVHTIPGNLKNQYYDYIVHDCTGSVRRSADPWALACGVNGKRSMVVDLAATDPVGWSEDTMPDLPSHAPAIWETHVRDFSWDPHSGVTPEHRGKYLAFTEGSTTLDNAGKFPTCMNYLKGLGVTHVQLQPIFDFCTVDEAEPEKTYNWGYDPENYNVPEGSYSTDPFHGDVRIRECKQMIQALHRAGLGVIMDVVYNHTFHWDSWFQRTAPGNYYRYASDGTFADASGCGNETASERAVFREYMAYSILYWATEYHIDGFRFDLMGVHDLDTMCFIRQMLDTLPNGKRILTYGEPWAAAPPQLSGYNIPADKLAISKFPPRLGIFCDDTRNLLAGSPFDATDQGYASGAPSEKLAGGIRAAVHGWSDHWRLGYASNPGQIVQYVSCHDNFALWDRLVLQNGDTDFLKKDPQRIQFNRLISGMYLTMPGLAFFQSGEEFGRTKFGNGNSFTGPSRLNQLDWTRAEEFSDLVEWYRGLLGLRSELVPQRRLTTASVRRIDFLKTPEACVGFLMSGKRWSKIAVFYNPFGKEREVDLPAGHWRMLCDGVDSALWRKRKNSVKSNHVTLKPVSVTIFGKVR